MEASMVQQSQCSRGEIGSYKVRALAAYSKQATRAFDHCLLHIPLVRIDVSAELEHFSHPLEGFLPYANVSWNHFVRVSVQIHFLCTESCLQFIEISVIYARLLCNCKILVSLDAKTCRFASYKNTCNPAPCTTGL